MFIAEFFGYGKLIISHSTLIGIAPGCMAYYLFNNDNCGPHLEN
jgi:hypothetical protein